MAGVSQVVVLLSLNAWLNVFGSTLTNKPLNPTRAGRLNGDHGYQVEIYGLVPNPAGKGSRQNLTAISPTENNLVSKSYVVWAGEGGGKGKGKDLKGRKVESLASGGGGPAPRPPGPSPPEAEFTPRCYGSACGGQYSHIPVRKYPGLLGWVEESMRGIQRVVVGGHEMN